MLAAQEGDVDLVAGPQPTLVGPGPVRGRADDVAGGVHRPHDATGTGPAGSPNCRVPSMSKLTTMRPAAGRHRRRPVRCWVGDAIASMRLRSAPAAVVAASPPADTTAHPDHDGLTARPIGRRRRPTPARSQDDRPAFRSPGATLVQPEVPVRCVVRILAVCTLTLGLLASTASLHPASPSVATPSRSWPTPPGTARPSPTSTATAASTWPWPTRPSPGTRRRPGRPGRWPPPRSSSPPTARPPTSTATATPTWSCRTPAIGGGNLYWFDNDGRGGFTRRLIGASGYRHDVEVGDLTGDGRPDVAARREYDLTVWYQRADGPAGSSWGSRLVSIRPGEGTALADVDGDGRLDILVGGRWLRNPGSHRRRVAGADDRRHRLGFGGRG